MQEVDALLEQTLWNLFWLPPWATRVDREELLYTWSVRPEQALNMVVLVRASGARLGVLVDEVSEAHRKVPSRWLLSPYSRSEALETELTRAGYAEEHHHHAFAVDPRSWLPGPDRGVEVRRVDRPERLVHSIRVGEAAFDRPTTKIPEDRVADELGAVGGPDARVHRFVAYERGSDRPLSSGGLNHYPDLDVAFLWGGGTVPEGRGRGAYRAVVDARMRCAAALGCRLVGVYARVDTSAPILEALGFERHGPW